MTDKEIKALKENLWHAADVLRAGAHLAANKYGQPILGLIFLISSEHNAGDKVKAFKSENIIAVAIVTENC